MFDSICGTPCELFPRLTRSIPVGDRAKPTLRVLYFGVALGASGVENDFRAVAESIDVCLPRVHTGEARRDRMAGVTAEVAARHVMARQTPAQMRMLWRSGVLHQAQRYSWI